MAEYTLDITALTCPMTLVNAKLKLEELAIGDHLIIRLREGEAAVNVPRSLAEHGQRVAERRAVGNGHMEIVIEKRR